MANMVLEDYDICDKSLRGYEKAIHDLKNLSFILPRTDGLTDKERIVEFLNKRLTELEKIHEENIAYEEE